MKGHIRPRGKNSWELKFDAGRDPATGERRIQYRSFRGAKRAAQDKLSELLAAVGKGEYMEPSRLTVGDYVRARVEHWAASGEASPKTAERYRHLVRLQIAPHLGAIALQKLSPFDLERWHVALAASGLAARTIGHAHRIVGKAIQEAVKNGIVNRNVAKLETAPKVERREAAILSVAQVKLVPEQLRGRQLYPIAVTALYTGLRRGEVLAMRWCNVDLEGGKLRVVESLEQLQDGSLRFKSPKTQSGRREVTLPNVVIDALRDHRRQQLELRLQLGLGKLPDDALVFQDMDGQPRSPRAVSIMWARFAEEIGAPDVTLHGLRHTHASMLIDANVDAVTISKRLGHASPAVTMTTYAHLFQSSDAKAADAINEALGGGKTA